MVRGQFAIIKLYRARSYESRRRSRGLPGVADITPFTRRIYRGFRSPRENRASFRGVLGLYEPLSTAAISKKNLHKLKKNLLIKIKKSKLLISKISSSMVHQLNNEYCLHNFCLMDFKSSLGMLSSSKNDISIHKQSQKPNTSSSVGPIIPSSRKSETEAPFQL